MSCSGVPFSIIALLISIVYVFLRLVSTTKKRTQQFRTCSRLLVRDRSPDYCTYFTRGNGKHRKTPKAEWGYDGQKIGAGPSIAVIAPKRRRHAQLDPRVPRGAPRSASCAFAAILRPTCPEACSAGRPLRPCQTVQAHAQGVEKAEGLYWPTSDLACLDYHRAIDPGNPVKPPPSDRKTSVKALFRANSIIPSVHV